MSNAGPGEVELLEIGKLEHALIEAHRALPGVLATSQYNRLRYALSMARMHRFSPGAAGGSAVRFDVEVDQEILAGLRARLLSRLGPILLGDLEPGSLLVRARRWQDRLAPEINEVRDTLLRRHADEFSPDEFDDEVGHRTLVVVAGGGGGAGYIYLGAFDLLEQVGLTPGLIVGSSMGSIIGLFRARRLRPDLEANVRFATGVDPEKLFRFVSLNRRYGLPGIMRLFLQNAIGEQFSLEGGRGLLLSDLEIPFISVVAGVRPDALRTSPDEWGLRRRLGVTRRPSRIALSAQIGRQLVQMADFLNPIAVKAIGMGADDLTCAANAVDAAGFSAAIPGILHYDVTREDPEMHRVLGDLMHREEVVALVDGGVAANVPAHVAWKAVREGRIGTRNTHILALDCFQPRLAPSHAWLWPVMRLVQVQLERQRAYMDQLVRFDHTLSPVSLLPSRDAIEKVIAAGRRQVEEIVPMLQASLQSFRWPGAGD